MWVRLTHIPCNPDNAAELKRIYGQDIVPVVMQQPGLVEIFLMEPTTPDEPFVSCTLWQDKASADLYESSGVYKSMVDKARHLFSGPPTLTSYQAEVSRQDKRAA